MQLTWHRYKYYPYERDLALREVRTLLAPKAIRESGSQLLLDGPAHPDSAKRLVYFASSSLNGSSALQLPTQQSLLERVNGNGANRQSTRYSVHGLHEYKGKFNPQVAKALLNIFDAKSGQSAIDPFCGSGTSLVECAHLGLICTGTDINPLAVFLANAKLSALGISANELGKHAIAAVVNAKRVGSGLETDDERGRYLNSWFEPDVLREIERLRRAIELQGSRSTPVLLAIASNLIREYSQQDPFDLRIRRRKSPLPTQRFLDAFQHAAEAFETRLRDAQATLGVRVPNSRAVLADSRDSDAIAASAAGKFDLALTSPPYATALPYIDTQRLSLVWLGLAPVSDILPLEARLIGSREIRGQPKKDLLADLEMNVASLPDFEVDFCAKLQRTLTSADGFRRQVVPRLLYRYFTHMAEVFASVRTNMKSGSPFGLIVGGNHTVLSGQRYDIDTPNHLARIAVSRGWRHMESIELQTYQRYGLHASNATTSEALVVLRA